MISESNILDALSKCGITQIQNYEKYIIIPCPFAKENHEKKTDRRPSFSINKETGTYYCYSCKSTGSFFTLIYRISQRQNNEELEKLASTFLVDDFFDFINEKKQVERKTIKIYPDEVLAEFPSATGCTLSNSYLLKREIPEKIADKYDIRVDTNHNRVCFPVRNRRKQLLGMQGRSFAEVYRQRYWNYWNYEKGLCVGGIDQVPNENHSETLVIVEGFFALLKIAALSEKLPTQIIPLTIFGSSVSYEQAADIMALDRPIVICLDNDSAGNKGAKLLKERLKSNAYQVNTLHLPKDIDIISTDEFTTSFNLAIRSNFDVTF